MGVWVGVLRCLGGVYVCRCVRACVWACVGLCVGACVCACICIFVLIYIFVMGRVGSWFVYV